MKDDFISELVRAGESQNIEFAAAIADVEKIGRTVCGFANAEGGTLIVGAKQGSVNFTPNLIPNLRQELLKRISPHIAFAIREVVFQHRNLILVDVPSGWDMPYTFDREIFVRVGEETRLADGLLVRELLAKRSALGPRWERQVAAGVSLHDLDATLLLRVATEAEGGKRFVFSGPHTAIEILRELDLAEGDSLRNSAFALFGQKPDRRFPQMRVRAVAYRGKDQESLKDSRMIGGNLFEILDQSLTFLKDHAPISSEIPREGLQRQQKAPFPFVAVREALLNAIIHRDYAPSDGSVSISIFSDRVEIWNIGGLPEGMTIHELSRVHASRPRNPDIAHLFMLHGQIERIGSGTRRILREFRSVGLPDPKWLAVSGGLLLTLPREKLAGAASSGQDLNPRQRAVLKNLQVDDVIRLADYLERSPDVQERQARADLKDLVEMGFLRRRGQARQTEYVRTEKQFD
ncbi:MAG: ATP-binding protein [Limisphaerales bacterium]